MDAGGDIISPGRSHSTIETERNYTNNTSINMHSNNLPQKFNWVQVHDTVVPVMWRHRQSEGTVRTVSYVPLSVLRHGAGLFHHVNPNTVQSTETECIQMSTLCTEAGFTFDFPPETELIPIDEIGKYHKVHVARLPDEDPFAYVLSWIPSGNADDASCIDAVSNVPLNEPETTKNILLDNTESARGIPPFNDELQNMFKCHEKSTEPGEPEEDFPREQLFPDNSGTDIWRPIPFSPNDGAECISDLTGTATSSNTDKPLDLSTSTLLRDTNTIKHNAVSNKISTFEDTLIF